MPLRSEQSKQVSLPLIRPRRPAHTLHTALPYVWRQTLQDLTVTIPVPSGSKGRDLVVEIKKKSLKVGLKGKGLILEGELYKEVKVDDSTWTLGA